jgi:glutathione S-transferase
MKLYWSPRSPFVRKVMVCARELRLADRIETVYALVSPSQLNAEVLRVNPIGRIPALQTQSGMVLYDSNVICEYLDVEHGSSQLFPKGRPQRWDTLKHLALADGMLETGVMWRFERTKPAPQQSSHFLLACDQKITHALAAAEKDASSLRLDGFDIGEIGMACALGYLDFRFVELDWRASCPRAAKWFETFNARESMQKTIPRQEQ